jgi:hypothetical protein
MAFEIDELSILNGDLRRAVIADPNSASEPAAAGTWGYSAMALRGPLIAPVHLV